MGIELQISNIKEYNKNVNEFSGLWRVAITLLGDNALQINSIDNVPHN